MDDNHGPLAACAADSGAEAASTVKPWPELDREQGAAELPTMPKLNVQNQLQPDVPQQGQSHQKQQQQQQQQQPPPPSAERHGKHGDPSQASVIEASRAIDNGAAAPIETTPAPGDDNTTNTGSDTLHASASQPLEADKQAPLKPPAAKVKEMRSSSGARSNSIPDPAVSLSASRPSVLPPPRLSNAATSFAVNATPTLTPGSTWGPAAASAAAERAEAAEPGRIGDLKRFTLWETKTRFYLVAYNTSQTRFRILKVDRSPPIANASNGTGPQATGSKDTATADVPSNTDRERDGKGEAKRNGVNAFVNEASEAKKTADSSKFSASGQRYLSEDDPEILRLNQRLQDLKNSDVGSKDGASSSTKGTSTSNMATGSTSLLGATGSSTAAAINSASTSPAMPQNGWTNSTSSSKAAGGHQDSDWELNVTSDRVVYSRSQVAELLEMIREGNRSSGGLKEVGRFFGIVGFIRFTGTHYMVLISRRSVVGLIGGHYIYHCDETVTLPVCHPSVLAGLPGRTKALEQEEARLLHLFKQVDLSKNFYFSYTYDLTKTLQDNLTSSPEEFAGQRCASKAMRPSITSWGYNEKFVWNHHLLLPAFGSSEFEDPGEDPRNEWVLPLVYGFVDQAKLSVLNRTVYVTLIARRSRHFAGARFLKRGVNEKGQVANDVETEQIVSEALTTPFFAPGRRSRSSASDKPAENGEDGNSDKDIDSEWDEAEMTYDASPRYTSYVMMRGSIPIYWTQDSAGMSARPPIEISLVDPYYSAAALHFDDLFHRYGTPVIVLNLIKSKEKQEREVKLLRAFGECVSYLNQFLPEDKKIQYIAWDMSRASKSRDQDVIGILEDIAEETIETTRFFHSGPEPSSFRYSTGLRAKYGIPIAQERAAATLAEYMYPTKEAEQDNVRTKGNKGVSLGIPAMRETILLQNGVARVNCVDCLDRTNAAQFVIGKAAFGHQLHALGLLDDPSLPFDSDAVNMLTEMYHDLGDTIAMQYGGSALAHTTDTYRKINQWTSHSRDVLESMKRYYANSFADADKQAAINLFLGVKPDEPDFSPYMFPIMVPRSSLVHDVMPEGRDRREDSKASQKRPYGTSAKPCDDDDDLVPIVPFRPNYRKWFDPMHLEPHKSVQHRMRRLKEVVNTDTGFWAEYYRPSLFTDLMRHHAFKMTAVHQYSHSVGLPHNMAHISSTASNGGNLMGHARSPSSSSISTLAPMGERVIEYSSPFKPRGSAFPHHGAGEAPGYQRNRRQSLDSISSQATSNHPAASGASIHGSPSSNSITMAAPSRALIGGVRRWMSINRPLGAHGDRKRSKRLGNGSSAAKGESGQESEEKGSKLSSALTQRTPNGVGSLEDGSLRLAPGTFDTRSFNFAGPWQAKGIGQTVSGVAGGSKVQGANSSLEAVLASVCRPSVSKEEEAEYSFYTTQFLREDAASGDALGQSAAGASESHHLVDEKDVKIYEEGVALMNGDQKTVDRVLHAGPGLTGVDPVLVAYADSAANAGAAAMTTNEARVRAFSSWLSMGQTKLAGFA